MSTGNIIKISNGVLKETATNDYTVFADTISSNAAGRVVEHSTDGIVLGNPLYLQNRLMQETSSGSLVITMEITG